MSMADAKKPAKTVTTAVSSREGALAVREDTATQREDAAARREEAADLRDEMAALREAAVRAREEALQATAELEQHITQIREANEHLIVGSVHAEVRVGQAAVIDVIGDRRTAVSTASPMPRLPRLDELRILVVDDDSDGRTLTSLVLTQAGASVRTAASVREALRMVDVERPDVLVSDIGLPDEDGYRLIRHIRHGEAEHGGFLPAVALTGYARAEDRARILESGFQAHVPKPVEPTELATAIVTVTQLLKDSDA